MCGRYTIPLLKKDAEVLSKVPPGQEPPPPILYDQAIHQSHREGTYRSLKPAHKRETIVLLPKTRTVKAAGMLVIHLPA